jgi:tRNA threonylcarbamoyladenosine modification (KEOPS) complex  Pcc1 subunit
MIEAAMELVEVGDTITITLTAPDEAKLRASGCLS